MINALGEAIPNRTTDQANLHFTVTSNACDERANSAIWVWHFSPICVTAILNAIVVLKLFIATSEITDQIFRCWFWHFYTVINVPNQNQFNPPQPKLPAAQV